MRGHDAGAGVGSDRAVPGPRCRRESLLTAINVTGDSDRKEYILESTGAGVAIFDFDNDGLMDVFLVNGTSLDGKGPGEKSTSHLYRNLGKLRLEDVTAKSGLDAPVGDRAPASATMTTTGAICS